MFHAAKRSVNIRTRIHVRAFGTSQPKRTALYEFHKEHGGQLVDFAGWSLPIMYKEGIMQSTIHTRTNASLFDVSHMGQMNFHEKDRLDFLQELVVGNLKVLKPNHGKYTLILNENGGIVDDAVITRFKDRAYMVINAVGVPDVLPYFKSHLEKFTAKGGEATMTFLDDLSLLALQGPKAAQVLQRHVSEDLNGIGFFSGRPLVVGGIDCQVIRCGYTGEDGFELSCKNADAVDLTSKLLNENEVELAGLGARDALRLESGLLLHGNDFDDKTTPVQADVMWTMSKKRRSTGKFVGADVVRKEFEEGPTHKRVGLAIEGAPARGHCVIEDLSGNRVGEITSGTFSPTLKRPIAMGYVQTDHSSIGTKLQVHVRKKKSSAEVVPLPFVETRYFKKTTTPHAVDSPGTNRPRYS